MAMTEFLGLFRGVVVSRSLFQAPGGSEGGGKSQYTYTSELACDRGGMEWGRDARLRRPVLGDRESRVAYRGCSFWWGANAAVVTTTEGWLYTRRRGTAAAHARVTAWIAHDWGELH